MPKKAQNERVPVALVGYGCELTAHTDRYSDVVKKLAAVDLQGWSIRRVAYSDRILLILDHSVCSATEETRFVLDWNPAQLTNMVFQLHGQTMLGYYAARSALKIVEPTKLRPYLWVETAQSSTGSA